MMQIMLCHLDLKERRKYCPFYDKWKAMLQRCYSEKFHKTRPSYIGCTVDPSWYSFMSFRSWMIEQDWEGNQLDKDLIIENNKVYSPETCIFVSGEVNRFMTKADAIRGEHPIGVSYRNDRNSPYTVFCGSKHVGSFLDIESAMAAYNKQKSKLAGELADKQSNKRVAELLRMLYNV